jgi:hypothetical protein
MSSQYDVEKRFHGEPDVRATKVTPAVQGDFYLIHLVSFCEDDMSLFLLRSPKFLCIHIYQSQRRDRAAHRH